MHTIAGVNGTHMQSLECLCVYDCSFLMFLWPYLESDMLDAIRVQTCICTTFDAEDSITKSFTDARLIYIPLRAETRLNTHVCMYVRMYMYISAYIICINKYVCVVCMCTFIFVNMYTHICKYIHAYAFVSSQKSARECKHKRTSAHVLDSGSNMNTDTLPRYLAKRPLVGSIT